MIVSKTVFENLQNSSWIRRMFEEGACLKKERGDDNVFDFTLGNPDLPPPSSVKKAFSILASGSWDAAGRDRHRYMPNAGFPFARLTVARKLARETALQFTSEDVFMTAGSAGACNVILKAILNPGDEVIVLVPFFPEYPFYISNHGGVCVFVETDESFLPDLGRIASAITPKTRAIIINTPNNPTGRVYPASILQEIENLLKTLDRPVLVISDEPYKDLVFDGQKQTEVASVISNTVICNSWSKCWGIPGERIGFLALSPKIPDLPVLRDACSFATRVLGFVNAPAIWQRVVAQEPDVAIDVSVYQEKRDLLCRGLLGIGYKISKPEGAFYVFAKTPIADDIEFVRQLRSEGILCVPGVGFGRGGFIRLSLTVSESIIERSLDGFERVFKRVRSSLFYDQSIREAE
jgi:aspartate aminotransferase